MPSQRDIICEHLKSSQTISFYIFYSISLSVCYIGAHEIGHIWAARYGSKGLDIAKKVYYNVYGVNLDANELLNFLKENVSEYCVKKKNKKNNNRFNERDFAEIIPEVLAKNVTNPDEFTSEFVKPLKERSLN